MRVWLRLWGANFSVRKLRKCGVQTEDWFHWPGPQLLPQNDWWEDDKITLVEDVGR